MLLILTSQLITQISVHNLASYGSGGAIYIYNGNGDFDLQINDTVLCRNRAFQGRWRSYICVHIYFTGTGMKL